MKFTPLFAIVLLGFTEALVTPRFAPRASVKASRSPLFRAPSFLLSSTDDSDDTDDVVAAEEVVASDGEGDAVIGEEIVTSSDAVTSDDKASAALGQTMVLSDDDQAQAKVDVMKNWGFILSIGIADLIAGCAAVAAPIYATAIAQVTQVAALFVIGFTNVLGVFFVEKGQKARSLLLGIAQIALGTLIGNNPVESRYLATWLIACLGFADGLYSLVLAIQNSKLAERGWVIFGGVVSMVVSCVVAANLDVASLFTLGAVLGGLFITAGWSRIFVALGGRDDANAIIDPTSATATDTSTGSATAITTAS